MKGKVKFYDRRKGYGFITSDNGEDFYFQGKDVRKGWLVPGDKVEFQNKPTRNKNDHAINIIKKERLREKLKVPTFLRGKNSVILLLLLIGFGVFIWYILSLPSDRLDLYQQFLGWGLLFIALIFIFSFVLTIPRKGKSKVRFKGELHMEGDTEWTIKTNEKRRDRLRVSRKISKWILISGGIITLVGLTLGSISQIHGYLIIGIGSGFLGGGLGLYLFRPTRFS